MAEWSGLLIRQRKLIAGSNPAGSTKLEQTILTNLNTGMAKKRDNYNEYMKNYMLARYHTRRNEAIHKFGGKCVKCGSVDNLEFDHINPADKLFTIGQMWSLNNTVYVTELNKCQLLCTSCHLEKQKQMAFC